MQQSAARSACPLRRGRGGGRVSHRGVSPWTRGYRRARSGSSGGRGKFHGETPPSAVSAARSMARAATVTGGAPSAAAVQCSVARGSRVLTLSCSRPRLNRENFRFPRFRLFLFHQVLQALSIWSTHLQSVISGAGNPARIGIVLQRAAPGPSRDVVNGSNGSASRHLAA